MAFLLNGYVDLEFMDLYR